MLRSPAVCEIEDGRFAVTGAGVAPDEGPLEVRQYDDAHGDGLRLSGYEYDVQLYDPSGTAAGTSDVHLRRRLLEVAQVARFDRACYRRAIRAPDGSVASDVRPPRFATTEARCTGSTGFATCTW